MGKKKIILHSLLFLFTTFITILISYITSDRLIWSFKLGYFGIICYRIFVSYCLYLLIIWVCTKTISLLHKKIFLFLYIALIIGFILSRNIDVAAINLQLGKIDDYSVFTFIGNIFMFLPVSFLIKYLYIIRTVYTILLISVSIIILEVLQYILNKGCLDINDIILNIFGCLLGIILFDISKKLKNKIKER
ncbi:MAG: VanZ family protein [Clostridia bacterium]